MIENNNFNKYLIENDDFDKKKRVKPQINPNSNPKYKPYPKP
jgi:hypothetical protein